MFCLLFIITFVFHYAGNKNQLNVFPFLRTISKMYYTILSPFYDGGRYHIETSPLIWGANQWTGSYMITVSVMKGLN